MNKQLKGKTITGSERSLTLRNKITLDSRITLITNYTCTNSIVLQY